MESHWYSTHMGRLKKLDLDVSVECSRTSSSRIDVNKSEGEQAKEGFSLIWRRGCLLI